MKTKTNKTTKTPKIRNRVIFSLCTYDIRTAADQSNGLLTDDCVKDILAKYDVAGTVAEVTTEAIEEILADYDKNYGLKYN